MIVENLTHLGQGRTSDGTLIPRVLPGEVVELAEDGTPRILSASSDRVAAPCRHYRACGGCAMQHASDAFVADWKAAIVSRALAAQGITATIAGVETSPPQSRRRAKLSGRRTKKGAIVGFHGRASGTITEVPDCRILTSDLLATIPALTEITLACASRKEELGLTVTVSQTGADLLIESDRPLTDEARVTLPALADRFGLARVTWNEEPVATLSSPAQQMGRARVVPPPGAFLQATSHAEATLVRVVRDGVAGAGRVADLFAGCGTFALPIAESSEVHAVESAAPMLAALDRAWRETPGLKRITTEARDLFRRPLLPDELDRFAAAVLDPPRAGAEAQTRAIGESHLKRVVMVSCNPVTFARDAKSLTENGFLMGPVTIVDQFRWSAHVECVSLFTRL